MLDWTRFDQELIALAEKPFRTDDVILGSYSDKERMEFFTERTHDINYALKHMSFDGKVINCNIKLNKWCARLLALNEDFGQLTKKETVRICRNSFEGSAADQFDLVQHSQWTSVLDCLTELLNRFSITIAPDEVIESIFDFRVTTTEELEGLMQKLYPFYALSKEKLVQMWLISSIVDFDIREKVRKKWGENDNEILACFKNELAKKERESEIEQKDSPSADKKKLRVSCLYCGRDNHFAAYCRNKDQDLRSRQKTKSYRYPKNKNNKFNSNKYRKWNNKKARDTSNDNL